MLVMLAGALGTVGRTHAKIYESLGVPVVAYDAADPESQRVADRYLVPGGDVILDVSTPTASHLEAVAWGYERGVRRFIVERPAATTLAEWRAQLTATPDAAFFVVHPYLFSEALRIATDTIPAPVSIATAFDKDRSRDDERGRAASAAGELPHLFQIDTPNQVAMALYLAPHLRLSTASYGTWAPRGNRTGPISGRLVLAGPGSETATLATNVRAPLERSLSLHDGGGNRVEVDFAAGDDLRSRVMMYSPHSRPRQLFCGRDDLLARTLENALSALSTSVVPVAGSAAFASSVLATIDDARTFAARDGTSVMSDVEPATAAAIRRQSRA